MRLARSPVWQDSDFVKFWSAASVSLIGDAVTQLALPLIAISLLDATPFQVGLVGGAQFLPFLLIGLPAGAIIDRLASKRRLLVLADLARALSLLSIPLAYAGGLLSLELLCAVAFLNGAMTVFFDVAATSYLPVLLDRERLVDGNAKLELSRSSAQIVGPATAGLLIQVASAPVALLADAVSFLMSGALIARVRRAEPLPSARTEARRIRDLGREIVEGARYVFSQPYVRAIALTTTTANFFRSALLAVLLVYLVREGETSAGAIGVAFAIGNVGFVTAALIAPSAARRLGVGRTMLAAVSLFGPAALLVAISPAGVAIYAAAAMVLIDSFGIGLHGVNQVSVRQAVTPPRLRGRMGGTIRVLMFGTMPLGMMLGGALGSLVGLRAAIWFSTAGLFLAALPYALSSTRRLVEVPKPQETGAEEQPPLGVPAAAARSQ
jgi:MFS family permease